MVLEATEPLLITLLRATHQDSAFYTPLYLGSQRLDHNAKLQPLRHALPNDQQRHDLLTVFLLFLLACELKYDFNLVGNDWGLPPMTFPETASLHWLAKLVAFNRLERSCADRLQDLLTGFTERHMRLGKGHLHSTDIEWAAGVGAELLQGMKTKFGVDLRRAVVENIRLASEQQSLRDRQVLQALIVDNAEVDKMFAEP